MRKYLIHRNNREKKGYNEYRRAWIEMTNERKRLVKRKAIKMVFSLVGIVGLGSRLF